jgi:hypothetical protein
MQGKESFFVEFGHGVDCTLRFDEVPGSKNKWLLRENTLASLYISSGKHPHAFARCILDNVALLQSTHVVLDGAKCRREERVWDRWVAGLGMDRWVAV